MSKKIFILEDNIEHYNRIKVVLSKLIENQHFYPSTSRKWVYKKNIFELTEERTEFAFIKRLFEYYNANSKSFSLNINDIFDAIMEMYGDANFIIIDITLTIEDKYGLDFYNYLKSTQQISSFEKIIIITNHSRHSLQISGDVELINKEHISSQLFPLLT